MTSALLTAFCMLGLFSSLFNSEAGPCADALGIMGLNVGPSMVCLFLLPVLPYSLSQVVSAVVQGFEDSLGCLLCRLLQ